MFHDRPRWMPFAVFVWFICCAMTVELMGQQDKPRPTSPTSQMQTVLRQLRSEAFAVQKGQQSMPDQANFAANSTVTPPPDLIAQNVIRTHHRDPFIDAYIRWQLTSFDPPLPELPQSRQQAVLRKLPQLEPNPLADQATLNRVNQLLQIPILTEQEQAQIIQEYAQLTESRRATNRRNVPATQLRLWMIKKLPPASRAGIEARAELLAALVTTGWEATGPKNLLQSSCDMAGNSEDLTDAERELLAQLLIRLIGLGSTTVNNLSAGDFTLQVDFRSSTIHDYEVRQWTRMLYGEDDQSGSNPAMQP